ncbi:MAG TPA: AsmA family protein [Hyphomicrobium sp.]|nr:AsmA family protein [Hyphomicrobium sp.]
MTGKADRRRPLIVLSVLLAVIGAALVVPVLIGARQGEPIPGSTVRAESHDIVAITSPVALFAAPAVTLERGALSLAAGNAGDTGVGALVRTLVAGRGVDLVLDDARFTVDRAKTPNGAGHAGPHEALSEALTSVVSTLTDFRFRNLTLSDATVVVLHGDGARETFSRIDADLTKDRSGLVTGKGRLAYRGEPLDFELAFTPPPHDAAELDVRVNVKGKYLSLAFNGRMPPGERSRIVAENAELSISDVRGAASWLGGSWPAGPGLGPFTAKGELMLDERAVSFANAKITLDGNAATGTLALIYAAERPSIEGTLAFATLDLAPYATSARPNAIARATGWLASLGIPGLADSSLVNELDADLRISAATVTNKSAKLGRAAASLTVKSGKLYGEIVELAFDQGGGGEAQFSADMTGSDPRYTIRADLTDIDFATLPRILSGPPALEGIGALKLDLAAEGSSEGALLRSIEGTMSVEMREAGRFGIDVDALPSVASGAPSEGWGAAGAGTTTVSGLSARFKASGGVFAADGVEARIGSRTGRLIGSADLDSAAVDFVLSLDELPGAEKSGKPVGAFRIQGPWAAPTIRPAEPGRAAQGVTKQDTAAAGRDPG